MLLGLLPKILLVHFSMTKNALGRVSGHLISGVAAVMGRPRQTEVRDRDSMTLGGVPACRIIMGLMVGISMSGLEVDQRSSH